MPAPPVPTIAPYVNPAGFPSLGLPNEGYKVWLALVIMIISSGLFVAARIANRYSTRQLGADDYTIMAALVSRSQLGHALDVGGVFRLINTGILPDPNDTMGYSSADRVWSGLSEAHRSSATGVQQMVVLWQRVLSYHDHAVQDVDLAAQQAHLRPSKFPARLLGHASDQWVLGNRELSRDPAGVPYVYI